MRNKFFILIFALVQTFSVVGQISTPTTLVVDQADLLNPEEEARLERKLVDYDDSTSTQIAVALIKSLEGKDSFDYAMELAKEWGVGQEGKNNGVVILVSMGDRQIRIVTGRGVEAELPDAICKRIINNKITPNFRNGAYYQGLDEATTEMIDRLEGRFVNNEEKESGGGFKPLIFYILFNYNTVRVKCRSGLQLMESQYRLKGAPDDLIAKQQSTRSVNMRAYGCLSLGQFWVCLTLDLSF